MQKFFGLFVVLIGASVLILSLVFAFSFQEEDREEQPTDVTELVVQEESVDAFGSRITLRHLCEGTMLQSDVLSQRFYCIGENELLLVDAQGDERSLVTVMSSSIDDAPILEGVEAIGYGDSSKLLFAFDAIGCRLTEDACGAGMPSHYINYLYSPSQEVALSSLANYPQQGDLLWNWVATKALVPVEQVGGAGCDEGVLSGYDLLADERVALTEESGCEFHRGDATDVTGDEVRAEWGPAYWSKNDEYTTVILNPDGTWEEITGTF